MAEGRDCSGLTGIDDCHMDEKRVDSVLVEMNNNHLEDQDRKGWPRVLERSPQNGDQAVVVGIVAGKENVVHTVLEVSLAWGQSPMFAVAVAVVAVVVIEIVQEAAPDVDAVAAVDLAARRRTGLDRSVGGDMMVPE